MRKFVLVLLSLIVLVGCPKGQSSQDTDEDRRQQETESPAPLTAPVADPCTLLSSRDLQEVLGEVIDNTEKVPSDDPTVAHCIIDTSEYPGRVLIDVSRHVSEEEARAAFQIGAEGAESVAELGDDAYLTSPSGEFELTVRKGLLVVRLSLVTEDPAGRDRVKVITNKALARL